MWESGWVNLVVMGRERMRERIVPRRDMEGDGLVVVEEWERFLW